MTRLHAAEIGEQFSRDEVVGIHKIDEIAAGCGQPSCARTDAAASATQQRHLRMLRSKRRQPGHAVIA